MLGTSPKFIQRVAVKKADMVKFRDAEVRTQGYQCKTPENKKSTADDILKLEAQLQSRSIDRSANASDRAETLQRLVASRNAARESLEASGSAGGPVGFSGFSVDGKKKGRCHLGC